MIYLEKKRKFNFFHIEKQIINIINEYSPDIIHTHLTSVFYLYRLINKFPNITFFHTIHNDPIKDNPNFLKRKIMNKMVKNKNFNIIALNEEYRKKSNEYYKTNNTIKLNNGIDNNKFEKAISNNILPKNKLVVGHLGAFRLQKNHEFIFKIFEEIIKINENSILVLVGNCPLFEKYKVFSSSKKYNDKIIFLGNRDDVPNILKEFDVFLFPSLYEGMPLSLLEAQYSGVNCVISDTINKESIIRNNVMVLSLNDEPKKWAQTVVNFKKNNYKFDSYNQMKISSIVLELENIYLKYTI